MDTRGAMGVGGWIKCAWGRGISTMVVLPRASEFRYVVMTWLRPDF